MSARALTGSACLVLASVAVAGAGIEAPAFVRGKLQGDAGRLPPAVYFAAMEFGGQSRLQKILILE